MTDVVCCHGHMCCTHLIVVQLSVDTKISQPQPEYAPRTIDITVQKVGVYSKVSKTWNVYNWLQVIYNMLTTF